MGETFRAPLHVSASRWLESEMQPYFYHQHVRNHVVQQGGQESVLIVLQTLAVVVSQRQVSVPQEEEEEDYRGAAASLGNTNTPSDTPPAPLDHLLRALVHPHPLPLQHHCVQEGVLPELQLVPQRGPLFT